MLNTENNFLNMSSRQVLSVTPIKLILQKADPYRDMYLRPYVSECTGDIVDAIRKKVDYIGRPNLPTNSLNDVASLFLKPSAVPTGVAIIDNGWGISRLKFQLEVKIVYAAGAEEYLHIMGFTSYDGVNTFTKNIDPNMVFNINSITKYINSTRYTNGILQSQVRFMGSDQVLQNQNPNVPMVSMRPNDVIGCIEAGYESHVDGISLNNILDKRSDINTQGKGNLSTRENGLPSTYMEKILSGYRLASLQADDIMNDNDIFGNARTMVYELNISSSAFITYMSQVLGMRMSTWFRYSDLCKLFPGIDQLVIVLTNNGANIYNLPTSGNTEDLSTISLESQAASMIIQSVPAIMTKCLISGISFTVTNSDTCGNITFIPTKCDSASNIDMTQYLKLFEQRFITEVYNGITFNNYRIVNLEVTAYLHSDIYIFISIDGGPRVPFMAPIFCDSLFTPVISNNENYLRNLSDNVDTLIKHADLATVGGMIPSENNLYSNSTF